jgi:hypothetical protein
MLRILRDYKLLCAVAHDALQSDKELRTDILSLHMELNPEVAEALMAKQPIPYQDCMEVYHRLADRVPNQKYVNSIIEDQRRSTRRGGRLSLAYKPGAALNRTTSPNE